MKGEGKTVKVFGTCNPLGLSLEQGLGVSQAKKREVEVRAERTGC